MTMAHDVSLQILARSCHPTENSRKGAVMPLVGCHWQCPPVLVVGYVTALASTHNQH